ncbi:kelch repeat and BTB domain-containing protein 2-like [Amphiura filiformis]|uniref:kelch repeat and BTB domain-containing protein 2-like n=1 Tax=Amphiura filiformis TaxID=82378 RepID=UPI003B217542
MELPDWIPDSIKDHAERKSHITQVFKVTNGLHKLQKNKTFCDITIKVEETSFPAHKAVLAACSEFFTAMFMSGFQESHKAEVTVTGTPDAFQVLLNFAYTGKLKLTMETAIDVLEMAHYIQFDDVVESCKSFLNEEITAQRVDTKAAVRIYSTADTLSLTELVNSCKRYMTDSFKKSEPSEDFLEHMTGELMEELLKNSDLTDEKRIFDTAVAWLQHHWEDRKQYAASFFQKIRLGVVPTSHLSKMAVKHPNLYSIPECEQLIDKVLEMVDPRKRKPNDPPLDHIDPSLFATRTTVNTAVFLSRHGHYSLFYDTTTSQWLRMNNFPDLPEKDCSDTLNSYCNAQGHIYVAQGTVRLPLKLKCPQFLKLDVANKKWYPLSPMIERRQNHPLVYMNGKIFAIGGGENRGSCEAYSIADNRWDSINSMSCRDILNMDSICCVAHKNENILLVYAGMVGTQEGNQCKHILQMFINDMHAHNLYWRVLMKATHPFSRTTSLVEHEGKCYRVVGGKCNCKEKGCSWHQIAVHELVIDPYERSATLGEEQDQRLIPAEFKKVAFRIKQDVFVIVCRQTYHKTGIKITSDQVKPVNLDMFANMFTYNGRSGGRFQFTTFMVDKALWVST